MTADPQKVFQRLSEMWNDSTAKITQVESDLYELSFQGGAVAFAMTSSHEKCVRLAENERAERKQREQAQKEEAQARFERNYPEEATRQRQAAAVAAARNNQWQISSELDPAWFKLG